MEDVFKRLTMMILGYLYYICLLGANDLEKREQISVISILTIASIFVIRSLK